MAHRSVGRTIARGLAWDIGPPLVVYYLAHSLGASDRVALLATTTAGIRLLGVIVRTGTLSPFAPLMVLVFGLGPLLSFVTGDARFLLVKESVTMGAVGAVFLVTALLGHPLTLAVLRVWQPAQSTAAVARFRADPSVRHGHRVSSTVWGAGPLTQAAIRVPLIYLLAISVMVGLPAGLMFIVIAGLIAWTGWYIRRRTPVVDAS